MDDRHFSWSAVGILLAGVVIRFVNLDADPHYSEWLGYVTDEGLWNQHARSLVLHGILFDSSLLNVHLVLAPFFQFCNYLVYSVFGVTLLSTRIFVALCGSALLVVFWAHLRHSVTSPALVLGLTLLAVQVDLVVLSRVAIPEMAVMLFQLLIYFLIVGQGKSFWRLSAGILLLVGCGMKATMVFFLPIFSLVILSMPRRLDDSCRLRDLAWFWTGFSIPVATAGAALFLLNPELASLFISMGHSLLTRGQFTQLSSGFLYNAVSFPFTHALSPTFSFWLLGVWLAALGWLSSDREQQDIQWRRYLGAAATWFISYYFLMMSMDYFPTRYKVHILVPLALIATLGVSRMQHLGLSRVAECYAESLRWSRFIWAGVITAPMAAFVAPMLSGAITMLGVDAARMRGTMLCFVITWFAISIVSDRLRSNARVVKAQLLFPLLAATVWTIYSAASPGVSFWPSDTSYGAGAGYWSMLVVLLLALTAMTVTRQSQPLQTARSISLFTVIYFGIASIGLAPGLFDSQYTVREASRNLGRMLPDNLSIAAIRAESLFNENRLRYKSIKSVKWPSEKPDILVVAFGYGRRHAEMVKREYRPIMNYRLYVSPDYEAPKSPNTQSNTGDGRWDIITVYAKNSTVWQRSQDIAVTP